MDGDIVMITVGCMIDMKHESNRSVMDSYRTLDVKGEDRIVGAHGEREFDEPHLRPIPLAHHIANVSLQRNVGGTVLRSRAAENQDLPESLQWNPEIHLFAQGRKHFAGLTHPR